MAALVLLALAWLAPGTAHATFPGANGKIAFQLQRDDVIRAVNPDGSGETFLTCRDEVMGAGRLQRLPAASSVWSPDGRRIAFSRYSIEGVPGFDQWTENWLFVLNPDGSQSLVARDGRSPGWSPDGERLAFETDGGFSLVAVNRDGSEGTTVDYSGFHSPTWSPDGERIAFARLGRVSGPPPPDGPAGLPPADIWVMNADGSDQTLVAEGAGVPTWSPAGERIAFMRRNRETSVNDVWVMNSDGSGQTQLTDDRAWKESQSLAWSPDGERISFSRSGGPFGPADIWVMNADGTGERLLAESLRVTWSPDSEKIAFSRVGVANFWVMNADGSDTRPLVPGYPHDWQAVPPGAESVPIPTQFCFTELRRNTNRGIARLTVEVSGPGRVILHERPGVRRFAQVHREAGPGRVVLRVRPRGRAERRLSRAGRTERRVQLPVRAQVTYRPWEGVPRTRGGRVWLVQR